MPNKIKVMTFNTYLLHVPLFSIGASTRNTRINAMIRDNIFSDVDIVIFQEVFSQDSEKKLFSGMRELGVIYHTPVAAQYNESILAYCDSNNCWNNKKGTWDIISKLTQVSLLLPVIPLFIVNIIFLMIRAVVLTVLVLKEE
ncbi:hypothetical protein [Providencia vermicola]|uniref:hypothetical protein n=1 Tax=Providencia vermicola TaxID=333965 RepID=UPI0034DD7D4E